MDEFVLSGVKRQMKNVKSSANVELLGNYDPQGVKNVFNPWACPVSEFELVYQHISRCIDKFVTSFWFLFLDE